MPPLSNQMNEPHIIRLRGPWQRQIIEGTELPPKKITMPSGWAEDVGADFAGTIEYQRFFNRPTGIDNTTSLRLRFKQVIGQATVSLNSELLSTESSEQDQPNHLSCDLTGKLYKRNDLRVRIVSAGAADGGLVGEVQLEIG